MTTERYQLIDHVNTKIKQWLKQLPKNLEGKYKREFIDIGNTCGKIDDLIYNQKFKGE